MLRLRNDVLLWPGAASRCLTLSFDDGTVEDVYITDQLATHGLAATFNLNPGLFGACDTLQAPYGTISHTKLAKHDIAKVYQGFEVAVHGFSHAKLSSLSAAAAAYEIVRCKSELEDIVQAPVRGMAWPVAYAQSQYCDIDALAKSCGIVYARTTRRTYAETSIPSNFMQWDPACSYNEKQLSSILQNFLVPTDMTRYTQPRLLYIWGHGYDLANPEYLSAFDAMVEQLSDLPDVWYATNIEVYDYICAAQALIYSSDARFIQNPSAQDVWLLIDGEPRRVEAGSVFRVPFEGPGAQARWAE